MQCIQVLFLSAQNPFSTFQETVFKCSLGTSLLPLPLNTCHEQVAQV